MGEEEMSRILSVILNGAIQKGFSVWDGLT